MACIRSCITREVVSLDESASCAEAARLMSERGIGSVGVRRGTALVGLVTERDLVGSVLGRLDAAGTRLGDVVRPDLPAVAVEATDAECAQLMRQRRTRHLAVKEGEAIVGVVSLLDLVELVLEEKQWDIDQLQTYIGGGRARQASQPITTPFQHRPPAA